MSVQFNSLNAFIQELPNKIPQKAMQGALVTTAIKISLGAPRNMALAGAGMAASMTLIDALMHSVLKNIFPENKTIADVVHIVLWGAAYSVLTQAAGRCLGTPYKVSNLFLCIAATLFLNRVEDCPNRATAYIF
jgi:hypothetical protein